MRLERVIIFCIGFASLVFSVAGSEAEAGLIAETNAMAADSQVGSVITNQVDSWLATNSLSGSAVKAPVTATNAVPPSQPTNQLLQAGAVETPVDKPLPSIGVGIVSIATNMASHLNKISPANPDEQDALGRYMTRLELAEMKRQRLANTEAIEGFVGLLQSEAPEEIKHRALLELGLALQQANELGRAQQVFAQFLDRYPKDPALPEVLLRQGILYRKMGSSQLALAKLYAVLTTALNLKLDQFEYYKNIVLQAQIEIAETFYLLARYPEAADKYESLLRLESPVLNRVETHYKLIRSLAFSQKDSEVVAQADDFLVRYADSSEEAEVRFMLANSLKHLKRNAESLRQVLLLLDSKSRAAAQNPRDWAYWKQRTGNEIANQLYQEGDYINALQIYLNLAQLDDSPAWQFPAYYQIGLVYERLRQPEKAVETFERIVSRQAELGTNAPESLRVILEMAKWRKDFVGWQAKADHTLDDFRLGLVSTNKTPATP